MKSVAFVAGVPTTANVTPSLDLSSENPDSFKELSCHERTTACGSDEVAARTDGATGVPPPAVAVGVEVAVGVFVLGTEVAVGVAVRVGVFVLGTDVAVGVDVLVGVFVLGRVVLVGVNVAVAVAVRVGVAVFDGVAVGVGVRVLVAVAVGVGVVCGGPLSMMAASCARALSHTSGLVDQLIGVLFQVGSVGSSIPYSQRASGTIWFTIACTFKLSFQIEASTLLLMFTSPVGG